MCDDPEHDRLVQEVHELNSKMDELTGVLDQMSDYILSLEQALTEMRHEQAEMTALFDPPFDEDEQDDRDP